jgi:hypothetical protein
VNKPHPRLDVIISGASRSLFAWRPVPPGDHHVPPLAAPLGLCVLLAWTRLRLLYIDAVCVVPVRWAACLAFELQWSPGRHINLVELCMTLPRQLHLYGTTVWHICVSRL